MRFLAVVIVNAFNSNLKERKKQIGMLRAVGATKRQIISIFGREAFCHCVSLEEGSLSDSVEEIAYKAFANARTFALLKKSPHNVYYVVTSLFVEATLSE